MATIDTWYGFLLQQVAAESYFEDPSSYAGAAAIEALRSGGNRTGPDIPISSATRLTDTQATEFLQRYQIIHQWSDDPRRTQPLAPGDPGYLELNGQQILANTGLSATLIKTIEQGTPYSNTYTLAIRSTENRSEALGGDQIRDRDASDRNGVVFHGFALAQVDALDRYYDWLKATGLLPAGAMLNVTGYSLGGHLATVFTELHPEVAHTFTFNGAGRGSWTAPGVTMADVLSFYRAALKNPEIAAPYFGNPDYWLGLASQGGVAAVYEAAQILFSSQQLIDGVSVYADPRYFVAIEGTAEKFGLKSVLQVTLEALASPLVQTSGLPPDVEARITQIVGKADHNDIQGVSTSGIHAPVQNVFIEDQPDLEFASLQSTGISLFEWASTHSITLIGDSLALTRLVQQVDPSLSVATVTRFMSAASDLTGTFVTLGDAHADTNSLERVVEHLGTALGVALQPMHPFDGTGGFGDLTERNRFFDNLAAIKTRSDELLASGAEPIRLVNLVDQSSDVIRAKALQNDNEGLAYRYAILEQSPFAVLGVDHQSLHNAAGELDFWNADTRQGQITPRLWGDRLAFYGWAKRANLEDSAVLLSDVFPQGARFVDHPWSYIINVIPGEFDPEIVPPSLATFQFGGSGPDAIAGDVFGDRLFARGGTDVLDGGLGSNILEGGAGMDLYTHAVYTGLLSNDENTDRILDSDGVGLIRVERSGLLRRTSRTMVSGVMPRAPDGAWVSPDGRFRFELRPEQTDATLLIRTDGVSESPILIEHFRDGDFGIYLDQGRGPPPTMRTVLGDRQPIDFDPVTAGTQVRLDAFGRPFVSDQRGDVTDDLLFGLFGIESPPEGTPQALIAANAGERIEGQGGDDTIIADPISRFLPLAAPLAEEVDGNERPHNDRDWIIGGDGSDVIFAGGGDDRVEGGSTSVTTVFGDEDVIFGGAGDDEIYADTRPESLSVAFAPGDPDAAGLRGDFLSGGAGRDQVMGGAYADAVLGGGGNDLLLGGAGNDVMWGDAGFAAAGRDWSVQRSSSNVDGVLFFDAVLDGVELRDVSAAGRDGMFGGSGNDWLFGQSGDDMLDGGADDDVLFGGGGQDMLLGGDGNDVLTGDRAEGVMPVDAGADYLDGGSGNDTLIGDAGDDILSGGPGTDVLIGGAGRDIYLFERGDGEDFIDDAPVGDGSEGSVLVLGPGFSPDAIRFSRGSLLVELDPGDADTGPDRVHFMNFMPSSPREQPALAEIRFADGGRLTYDQILARGFDIDGTMGDDNGLGGPPQLIGTAVADRIRGLDGDDVIFADGGADRLDGGRGDDVMYGDAGDDTLIGGEGADALFGGAGNDRFVVDASDHVTDDEGVNVYAFGSDVAPADVVLHREIVDGRAAYTLYVHDRPLTSVAVDKVSALGSFEFADGAVLSGADLVAASPDVPLSLIGTDAADRITGKAAADFLQGLGGDDTIIGGAGNDLIGGGEGNDLIVGGHGDDELDGGSGDDVYRFDIGDGHDSITIGGLASASTGIIRFGAGVDRAATRVLRDTDGGLRIAYGDGDTVRIPRFYWDSGGGVARIEWADGTSVDQAALLAMPSPDIVGSAAADTLTGGAFAERLIGDASDDVLSGLGGDDTIDGGAGADVLDGGAGADMLDGGPGNDTYRLAVDTGRDVVRDGSGPNTIVLGDGLVPDDVSVTPRGADLEIGLLGLGDALVLRGAAAHADDWSIVGSHGTATTVTQRLTEQAATDDSSMDAVRNAAWRAVHATWAADLARQGLQLAADDTWARTRSPPITVTLVRTNDAIQRSVEHLDGTIDGGSGIVPGPDDWAVERRTPATPRIFHDTGSIERDVMLADAATVVRARPDAETTETTTFRHVAMTWSVRWDGTRVTRNTTRSTYLDFEDGGPGSSNTGGPRQVLKGWFLTTDVHREATGVATGTIGAFVDNPAPVTSDSEPEHLPAQIVSRDTIYRYTETLGDDAGNRIEGGYFAAGAGGDDVILGVRVAYGGDGNDDLEGGEVLFGGDGDDVLRLAGVAVVAPYTVAHGGDGNDRLLGGDRLFGDAGDDTLGGAVLLDGGDGDDRLVDGATLIGGAGNDVMIGAVSGSVFRFDAGEAGLDQVFAPGVDRTTVLDRFYRARGLPLWEYQRDYPGRYATLTDSTPVITDHPIDGAILLAPLPPGPPIPAANDFIGIAQLVQDGLLPADVVEFGAGIAREQVAWSSSTRLLTDPFGTTDGLPARYAVLTARLAPDQAVDFILPRADSPLGSGIEQFRFADGTVLGLADVLATLPAIDLDPRDGPVTLVGTSGPDDLRGLRDNDVLIGAAGDDTLVGGAGNDLLDGGSGIDQLFGDAGNDTYVVDDARDVVIETDGNGWDLVRSSSAAFTLPAAVEGLELLPGATAGRGNALANHLVGSAGNDTLRGAGGGDILQGAAGRDVIYDAGATPGRVVVSATAGGAPGTLVLGQLRIDGAVQRSFLLRAGRESSLVFNLDIDPALAHQVDVIHVASGGPGAAADRALIVRGVTLGGIAVPLSGPGAAFDAGRGAAAFDGVGVGAARSALTQPGALRLTVAATDRSNDLLDGGAGNDTLVAGAGNDLVAGGPGDDRLSLYDGADVIAFDRGDGTDTVFLAKGATPTLSLGSGIGIDDIVLSRDRDTLTVDTGAADRIRFVNWYARGLAQREARLQLIDPGTIDAADGADAVHARVFDLDAAVRMFDAATSGAAMAGAWSAAHALLDQGGDIAVDDAVIGGAPAAHYALQRGFGALGLDAVQGALDAPAFGASVQAVGGGTGAAFDPLRRLI